MSTFGDQPQTPGKPPTVVAAAILQLLGYLAVAILLALPTANAFFRKATPAWQPPTT